MSRIDFRSVNRAALAHLPDLLRRWFPDGRRVGQEWVALNPRRDDRLAGSFSINVRTGRWADFACDAAGGDVISLRAYLDGSTQSAAARRIQKELRHHG